MGNQHNGGASWEQNAIVGNVPTIISARDSDLVGNRIFQTSCLENKVCNTNRQEDVARFSGNELQQQAPKNELVLLHTCEHAVPDKHDHTVVLQRNTTEFRWGTIIEDIEVLCITMDQHLTFFPRTNQSVAWCATEFIWNEDDQSTDHIILCTCMADLG